MTKFEFSAEYILSDNSLGFCLVPAPVLEKLSENI
jgi:hypothetical protein